MVFASCRPAGDVNIFDTACVHDRSTIANMFFTVNKIDGQIRLGYRALIRLNMEMRDKKTRNPKKLSKNVSNIYRDLARGVHRDGPRDHHRVDSRVDPCDVPRRLPKPHPNRILPSTLLTVKNMLAIVERSCTHAASKMLTAPAGRQLAKTILTQMYRSRRSIRTK